MAEASNVVQKRIMVNGVLIKVDVDKRGDGDSKRHGAGKPEDYLLQGDKHLYKPEDWVNFEEDKVFITIPQGATDVA